jgi:hypothetical protein
MVHILNLKIYKPFHTKGNRGAPLIFLFSNLFLGFYGSSLLFLVNELARTLKQFVNVKRLIVACTLNGHSLIFFCIYQNATYGLQGLNEFVFM